MDRQRTVKISTGPFSILRKPVIPLVTLKMKMLYCLCHFLRKICKNVCINVTSKLQWNSVTQNVKHEKLRGSLYLNLNDFLTWAEFQPEKFIFHSQPMELDCGTEILKFRNL